MIFTFEVGQLKVFLTAVSILSHLRQKSASVALEHAAPCIQETKVSW